MNDKRVVRSKGTAQDDQWAWNRLMKSPSGIECASYRYMDPDGVVHRAVWEEREIRQPSWRAACGATVIEKLQEGDAGPVTCVRCLGSGA